MLNVNQASSAVLKVHTMSPLQWLQQLGGWYDSSLIELHDFAPTNMGVGAIALLDIPNNTPLFSIPHRLLLSPFHSKLRQVLPAEAFEILEAEGGGGSWAALILCLMWEDARGEQSDWFGYLCMYLLIILRC